MLSNLEIEEQSNKRLLFHPLSLWGRVQVRAMKQESYFFGRPDKLDFHDNDMDQGTLLDTICHG